MCFPGLVIAGLRGGAGKTVFSVGIITALRDFDISVAPFKKGPDYIDSGWLSLAAGRLCHNLDTFLLESSVVLSSYKKHTESVGIAVVEGNRGLYDCISTNGETSTAALAKLLGLPVILCVDVTKATRTIAAIVSGVLSFDSDVCIGGIILNRIAGMRHQRIITRSIERYCGIPVLGAVPKLTRSFFPERHMGLVPTTEHDWANASIKSIGEIAKRYLNLDEILKISNYSSVPPDNIVAADTTTTSLLSNKDSHKELADDEMDTCSCSVHCISDSVSVCNERPVVGIMVDPAFQFYYPENLEALENAGASLVFISPINDKVVPSIDALYIGGGFPETHADKLEKNIFMRKRIKLLAETGLPIYAECGGLVYLGKRLFVGGVNFMMSGVFSVSFKISKRPQGHGYTVIEVKRENPYYQVGSELLGHEFHYSSVLDWKGGEEELVFVMKRGTGIINGKDGLSYKNVLATYSHIHSLGTKSWALSLVKRAKEYMEEHKKGAVFPRKKIIQEAPFYEK